MPSNAPDMDFASGACSVEEVEGEKNGRDNIFSIEELLFGVVGYVR